MTFLAGQDAAFITGQVIPVNGGAALRHCGSGRAPPSPRAGAGR
nr:hypothetical protein [Streptomyces kanamyceticus]